MPAAVEALPGLLVGSGGPAPAGRVCLVYVARDVTPEPISGLSFDAATLLGTRNLGNQVWEYAARSLLSPEVAQAQPGVGRRRQASALLVPQANCLRTREDTSPAVFNSSAAEVERLADMVVQHNLPTLIVGIGAQSARGADPQTRTLAPEHLRLLREVSQRGAISVRGQFTADVIQHNGGPPTVVAGCPSLFLNKDLHLGRRLQDAYCGLPALSSTRQLRFAVGLPAGCLSAEQLTIALLRLVGSTPGSFVVVQDANDYTCIDRYGPKAKLSYRSVRYFYSVPAWAEALHEVDALVSARIHGSMMGLAVVKPVVVIATDMRILELAEAMRMPYIVMDVPALQATSIDTAGIWARMATSFDGAAFDANRYRIASLYRNMFDRIGMPLHPAVQGMAAAHERGGTPEAVAHPPACRGLHNITRQSHHTYTARVFHNHTKARVFHNHTKAHGAPNGAISVAEAAVSSRALPLSADTG